MHSHLKSPCKNSVCPVYFALGVPLINSSVAHSDLKLQILFFRHDWCVREAEDSNIYFLKILTNSDENTHLPLFSVIYKSEKSIFKNFQEKCSLRLQGVTLTFVWSINELKIGRHILLRSRITSCEPLAIGSGRALTMFLRWWFPFMIRNIYIHSPSDVRACVLACQCGPEFNTGYTPHFFPQCLSLNLGLPVGLENQQSSSKKLPVSLPDTPPSRATDSGQALLHPAGDLNSGIHVCSADSHWLALFPAPAILFKWTPDASYHLCSP